jgi:PAS domain S-box-containing protein
MAPESEHYLKRELYALVQTDRRVFDFIQNASLDGLWYWNAEKPDDEWISPRFWRVLGYDPAAMPHDVSAWQRIIDPEDLGRSYERWARHAADPSDPYDHVLRYRCADGSTRWLRSRGIAIRDAAGRPIRFLGAANDVTPIKELEQEARRDAEALRTVNAELRQFSYAMSHDMKAPANSVRMLLDEIAAAHGDALGDDGRALLAHAVAANDRMRALVDETLAYTRVIGAEQAPERFDPRAVAREAVDALGALIAETGASVVVGGAAGPFCGHRWQVGLLLQNLIENAIKYRRPDVRALVAVSLRDEPAAGGPATLTVTVRDNGLGIAPEHRERVFGMFQRLHRHDEIPGAGLGLAICQRVARQHGGSIALMAAPGGGAVFIVTLREANP